jgi:peptidoglycan/xylan/chitin deacetylase (PgdA/CDA1 family)
MARSLYLDAAKIGEMARGGMTFGYHTQTHRMLSRLDAGAQVAEVAPGVRWIRDLTGQARVPFCYPWGGPHTYTAATLRILAESGYSLAFNTVRRRLQVGVDHRFEIPRFDTRDLPPHTAGEADAVAAAANGEA